MGMFDSLYKGRDEWQTKAYHCNLDHYFVGDEMPDVVGTYYGSNAPAPTDYQVEILGGPANENDRDSFATVRNGVLTSIDDTRNSSLPLVNYSGHLTPKGN